MKLRNLLLTAALVFAAGTVAAVETVTEEDNNASQFIRDTTTGSWATSGNNTLGVVLIDGAGQANDLSGYSFYAVGHNTTTGNWEVLSGLALSEESANGRQLFGEDKEAYRQIYKDFGAQGNSFNGAKVYEFKVAFDATQIDRVGVVGRNGSSNQEVESALNNPATNKSVFRFNDSHVNALGFVNGSLHAVLVLDASNETMGNPLPAPIVTLLIALGFGAALVMYRNRKQVNA